MTEDRVEFPENEETGGETEIANETDNADVDGDIFTPVVSAEDNLLIKDTISFINHTISQKALEAALLIGDHILTRYFDNDIEAAFSKDSDKPISFNVLCNHPDLRISRYKLVNMVKVAAQERFLQTLEYDFSPLHYSHRLKLTALPNDEGKIDMARECVAENLTTRQLGYRIRQRVSEMEQTEGEGENPEPDPIGNAVNAFVAAVDHLTSQAAALHPEPLEAHMQRLSPETKGLIEYRVMALSDTLDETQMICERLLLQLRPGESAH
jgi:hypothetical protein